MNSFCSFCASAGIKGPHDHFLRASKYQGAAVVCPKLLSTECNYCHRNGHTVKFCGAKREQEMQATQARAKAKAARVAAGDWVDATSTVRSVRPQQLKPPPPKPTKLTGMFAGLGLDDSSSSDEDEDQCIGCESGVDCEQSHTCTPQTTTWAQIVRAPQPKPSSLPDVSNIVFGRKTMTRWADEVED